MSDGDPRRRDDQARSRAENLSGQPLVAITSARGIGTIAQLRRVLSYRELLDLLVRRELKVRYKDSSLGFLWTLIRPLALLFVYWIAIGKFLGAERSIDDFAIYLFTGLTLWQLTTEIMSSCTASILANQGLIKKVDLPLEVFPLASVGSALFNFGIQLLVLLGATAVLAEFPLGSRWFYAPLGVAVVLTWATGLGFILAALNVYLRDVQYLVEIVLMIGFWACPVVYSWKLVSGVTANYPMLQELYLLNPIAVAIMGFQETFWVGGDGEPDPTHLVLRLFVMLAVGLLLLVVGQRVFQRLSGDFAQEL